MLRKPYILPLLLVAVSYLSPSYSRAQVDPERQQVELAEQAGGRAAALKDYSMIKKYWSPQLLVNSPGNDILTRDQVFEKIAEDKLKYSGYTNKVEVFRIYGDTAVIMGNETLIPDTGPEAGTRLYRRYTDVMQRTGGAWTLIARQATYTDPNKIHYSKSK